METYSSPFWAEERVASFLVYKRFFSGSTDPKQLKKRASMIEINNCGAVCRKLDIKGNQIVGEVETLSGFKGPDLAKLIVEDKVDIGFSLRALGGVEPLTDGTLMVKDPILPITYDVVSSPSHANARIMEFLPEHDSSLLAGAETLIYEGNELSLLEDEDIVVNPNSKYISNFLDNIIEENFKKVVKKSIRFKV